VPAQPPDGGEPAGRNRDRDPAGRARNARPRDRLGRPLPRDAKADVERVPDRLDISPAEAVDLAQRYLDDGRPFHAHEVLEAMWKSRSSAERDLWQGLAQVAVGLTHALRGNRAGALALVERGTERLARHRGEAHGVDVGRVLAQADAIAAALRADAAVGDATVALQLRAP
jgi:predicted metal-dependent hydrolase